MQSYEPRPKLSPGAQTSPAAGSEVSQKGAIVGSQSALGSSGSRVALQGWPIDRCLPFANAAAALNCRHLGGVGGIPSLSEVTRVAGLSG